MFSIDEMLKRMEAGESADDIANEFSKVLTDANKTFQANVEKRYKEEMIEKKHVEMGGAIKHFLSVIEMFWPDLAKDAIADMTEEDKSAIFDAFVDAIVIALDKTERDVPVLASIMGVSPTNLMRDAVMPNAPVFKKPAKSDDDILNSFLNSICH